MSREQFVFLGCHLAIAKGLLDRVIPYQHFHTSYIPRPYGPRFPGRVVKFQLPTALPLELGVPFLILLAFLSHLIMVSNSIP